MDNTQHPSAPVSPRERVVSILCRFWLNRPSVVWLANGFEVLFSRVKLRLVRTFPPLRSHFRFLRVSFFLCTSSIRLLFLVLVSSLLTFYPLLGATGTFL